MGGTVSVGGGATPTRRVEKAALLVVLLSFGFVMATSNRAVFHPARVLGMSHIDILSVASDASPSPILVQVIVGETFVQLHLLVVKKVLAV